jgi:hypothetical protein
VVVAAVGGYAWWATDLRPFTLPSLAAVLLAGAAAAALGAGLIPRDVPPLRPRHPGRWAGLAAAVGLWELVSFFQQPRAEHPTLSSLLNRAFESHPVRTLGFGLWLGLCAWFARRTVPARPPAGRVLLLGAWLWVGWHAFVRASY